MILSFDKTKKIRSTEEHNKMYMSEAVTGTYVSNMSETDKKKFHAKHIKGENERIEIRVEIGGVNCNIFVFKESFNPKYPNYPEADPYEKEYPAQKEKYDIDVKKWQNRHQDIMISMNGKMDITYIEWTNIITAIEEARGILRGYNKKI